MERQRPSIGLFIIYHMLGTLHRLSHLILTTSAIGIHILIVENT